MDKATDAEYTRSRNRRPLERERLKASIEAESRKNAKFMEGRKIEHHRLTSAQAVSKLQELGGMKKVCVQREYHMSSAMLETITVCDNQLQEGQWLNGRQYKGVVHVYRVERGLGAHTAEAIFTASKVRAAEKRDKRVKRLRRLSEVGQGMLKPAA